MLCDNLFHNDTVFHQGIYRNVISDHDPGFTSDSCYSSRKFIGTKVQISTLTCMNVGGHDKRANCVLEDMLRSYIAQNQTNSNSKLTSLHFVYDSPVNLSIG